MEVHVSLVGRRDLAGQIYRQVRDAVLDGRIRAGEALPPTRELATRLAVSRTTVSAAYDRLTEEGFLVGRVGAGSFVAPDVPDRGLPDGQAGERTALRPREIWEQLQEPPYVSARTAVYDFRTGLPDIELFPFPTWRRLIGEELRRGGRGMGAYGDPRGLRALRAAIARHIGVSRGVRATSGDVIVTSGTQQALDLIGRVLIEPGDCVVVEDPGYPLPRMLFTAMGARVVGVPVDADGLQVAALPDRARLVYLTPSHQYPLGVAMSLPRRMALLDWAERHGAALVEDDYDSEFRFRDRPLETLHSIDRSGRVLYVGSFSKVLSPSLRLGYLVAPRGLHAALRTAKLLADWHSPALTQAALARFIDDGLLAAHLRRMRQEYQARHELITRVLLRDFADRLVPVPAVAGLHLAAAAPDLDPDQLAAVVERARRAGVVVERLSTFAVGEPAAAGLVFGYGAIRLDRIEEGLRRIHDSLADRPG